MEALQHVLMSFSETDHWRAVDAVEGTFISGSPGSGKTTTSAKRIAHSFLKSGYGGLVLTAKGVETQNWLKYIEECGRQKDLILFNAEGGDCFDPLFYEWNRPGRGAADLESIIDMFSTLLAIGRPNSGSHSADRFWELAVEQLMRNVIVMLSYSSKGISIKSINATIRSLPQRPGQHDEKQWLETSYCAGVMSDVQDRLHTLTPEQKGDVILATDFMLTRWPAFDERPRSSIEMTWAGMADKFLFTPFSRLFCGGQCTFIPEHTTHAQKIVICDFPVLEYGVETGRLINCLLKISFMRAWLRRDVNTHPIPAFLWQDEGQMFLLGGGGGASRDNAFAQVARGSRICTVFITQNILNIAEALGENQAGARTKSLLGNFALKIFHQQNDVDSNIYAADLIGKEYAYLRHVNIGADQPSISHGEQLIYKVEPNEFTELTKPDTVNPCASAIIYQGGKPFACTATVDDPKPKNYMRMKVSR